MLPSIVSLILLATATCAATIPKPHSRHRPQTRAAGETAAEMLLQIAPNSASCADTSSTSECRTNVQAAPYLIQAFIDYGITNVHEMAAVLSTIAYETADFKYNVNQFPAPGTPGQGTRNMQSAGYNFLYAQSIDTLKSSVVAIAASASALTTDAQKNAVRALVLPDEYSWASGAWFLTTQCSSTIRAALQAGGQAAWETYLTGCLGTSVSDRLPYWTRANAALGIS
jgi:hypothetical protein